MTNETCPHCGADETYCDKHYSAYNCGAMVWRDGTTGMRQTMCYERQLGQQAAKNEILRQALEDYGDNSEKCKRKGADCFCGFDAARGEVK